MAIRKIVHIDESKCNGCGLCIPNCAEGALKIIDGKARLVSEVYCDGLGACLGHCPQDAITVIEREAEEFDEEATMEFLASERQQNEHKVKTGHNDNEGHGCSGEHKHGNGHGCQGGHNHGHHVHHGGCPGSQMRQFNNAVNEDSDVKVTSKLRQWPVQLELVPPNAPYLRGADLLVTADCVPFAYGNYHNDFLKDRAVVVGCPKLDDTQLYIERLEEMIKVNDLNSITVLRMEVPCCGGMAYAVQAAREKAGVDVPVTVVTIGIQGEIKGRELV